ncbi:hypothetical protein F5883DRAFT_591039 [Diaporthe sp. PMI_573]|nr:hypothetical protein F5883DRAFT_591039 [Diaporthaceae sp. PMI_573]
MAKIIYIHKWGRDFDTSADSLLSLGQYKINGSQYYFMLDNNLPESADPDITVYR